VLRITPYFEDMYLSYWIVFFGLVSVASCALTAGLWRYALHREWLDVPNARSSHELPTPRGGGLAVVVTVLMGRALR
jgi:Fuc2NAc and GlcNAc transferase